MPARLRRLGRLAVWAISGSQFIDVIWREYEQAGGAVSPHEPRRGARLTQAELAALIERAEPKHPLSAFHTDFTAS